MHVGMVLRKPFPPDVRVEKEARALLDDGHEVTLLCRADGDRPATETVDGVDVVRIDHLDGHPFRRRAETLRFFVTAVHPAWERALRAAVRERGLDAIHVHDLPLVRTALRVGRDHDVPVVADLHENYPEAVRQWRRMDRPGDVLSDPGRIAWYLLFSVPRLKRLERRCVRRADHVLAVCEESRRHYLEDCLASPFDVSVVGNTVDPGSFDADAAPAQGFDDEFVVAYVGKYAPHRGLESVVDAFPAVVGEVPNARLLVVGTPGEPRYDEALRERCERRGLAEHVTFTGWVDFERVPAHVAASDVCLVPHERTPHTDTTIPHKLFQYMAMGKPVVVSDAPPLARVVDDAEAGVVVPDDDPGAMADALAALAADPEWAAELGSNGRAAVERRYNWAEDAAVLREVYRSTVLPSE